jgi:hypothetical protein
MKEARHIATGRIVRASEVDYPDYHGIFQCPHCKVALRLRKEYTRSDGTTITAAFIHPPGETELEKKCPYRINLNFSDTKPQIYFPNSREQCFKLLKKNFLKCLKHHSKVSITERYSKNKEALNYIDVFMALNHKIIAARQNGRYILELQESQKIQKILQEQMYERINSYDKIRKNIALLTINNELDLVKQKSNSIIWGLEFIINEASDNFLKETLDYIFCQYVETHKINFLGLEHEVDIGIGNMSFGEIKKIFGFELNMIKEANEILSNDKLINNFFEQMYTKKFAAKNEGIFNEIKNLHHAVFNCMIDYLINFPWHRLLF